MVFRFINIYMDLSLPVTGQDEAEKFRDGIDADRVERFILCKNTLPAKADCCEHCPLQRPTAARVDYCKS
jgi:hypothetical protein